MRGLDGKPYLGWVSPLAWYLSGSLCLLGVECAGSQKQYVAAPCLKALLPLPLPLLAGRSGRAPAISPTS